MKDPGSKVNTILNYASMGMIIITLATLTLVFVALLWPYDVIEVSNVRIVTEKARIGDAVVFHFDVKKYMDVTGHYTISMQDGQIYNVQSGQVRSDISEFRTQKSIVVPPEILPGKYYIRVVSAYQVNPLRVITVKWKTENTVEIIK